MPKIIVLDKLAKEGLQRLDEAKSRGVEYDVKTGLKGAELHDTLLGYEGAICRSGVKLNAEALDGNTRLRAIVRAGVGVDNIDLATATRQGMVVMNTPTGNTLSTAEHALAMMMALSRNIAPAYLSLCQHKWDRGKYMGAQLADKTLGIVGLGRIGQAIAQRARALEMHLVGYDPFLSPARAAELGVTLVKTVEEMLPMVDYLTVHTPLTEETRNMIDLPQLDRLKPGVRLINCARGGIYNEAALVEGLKRGVIAGVAIDVFAEEPCTDSPLFGMEGVLATPHLGASTEEAQIQVAVEGVGLLVDYLANGVIRHAVNTASIDRQKLAGLRGYLNLAYRLGMLHSQADREPARACALHYRGAIRDQDTKLVTAAYAAGLLQNSLEGNVNIINAPALMQERGIKIEEHLHADPAAFSSLLTADLVTGERRYRASGTLFGNEMPRLVQLDDYRLEAYLDGVLLLFRHNDVPGIIGAVGTIFGNHKVNIAQMTVGRGGHTPGGDAIGVLNLDNAPPKEALDEVSRHPDIKSVRVIHLPPAGEYPSWMAG